MDPLHIYKQNLTNCLGFKIPQCNWMIRSLYNHIMETESSDPARPHCMIGSGIRWIHIAAESRI
jgi:hypothetical protein